METNPNEPTLTCSEVVERLRRNCLPGKAFQSFDVTKAEKILTEWRERRVQELEEALREMVKQHGVHSGECFSCDYFVRETGRHNAACLIPKAESLLANSEQIRKGAKHESKSVPD